MALIINTVGAHSDGKAEFRVGLGTDAFIIKRNGTNVEIINANDGKTASLTDIYTKAEIDALFSENNTTIDFDNLAAYPGYTWSYSQNTTTKVETEILTDPSGTEYATRIITPTDTGYTVRIICAAQGLDRTIAYTVYSVTDMSATISQ